MSKMIFDRDIAKEQAQKHRGGTDLLGALISKRGWVLLRAPKIRGQKNQFRIP
jgi:hypothetical protein